jgi:predicted phage gp36 major capsid-like protein
MSLLAPVAFSLFAWLSKQAHGAAMARFKSLEEELRAMRAQQERHEDDDARALQQIAINQATVIERLDNVKEQLHASR